MSRFSKLMIQGLAEGKPTGRIQDNDDLDAKCWYCLLTRCEEQAAGIGPVHSACLEHVRKMTRIGESVRPGSAGRLGLEELR